MDLLQSPSDTRRASGGVSLDLQFTKAEYRPAQRPQFGVFLGVCRDLSRQTVPVHAVRFDRDAALRQGEERLLAVRAVDDHTFPFYQEPNDGA
jgi:hypothetical protein